MPVEESGISGLLRTEAESQPRSPDPLRGRFGLTVPHEWWPSAHLLKSFEAAGFAHAQIDAPPFSVLRDARLLTRHAIALHEALATTDLGLILHAPAGLMVGDAAGDQAMDGLLEYAAEIGAAQIVYHALALPDEVQHRDRLRRETLVLGRAARRASELGIGLAVENLCPLYPGREPVSAIPASLRSLVRRVGAEGVGICLDLGHAHVVAELRRTSLERLIEPVMSVVTLFHAHDNFGGRQLGAARDGRRSPLGVDPVRLDLHLPPGRGTLPWHEIAPLVAAHGAPVVLEVHPPYRPRAEELREDAAALLRAS